MDAVKKELILLEAARCFGRFGFKKASIDDIARGAGVAKGTVYLACSSKEELYYQVLHREVRAWQAEVARLIDPRKPADELLEVLSASAFATLEDHPLVKELMLGKVHELLPSWRERLDELRDIGHGALVEVLRLGARQGAFRKDLDHDESAAVLHELLLAALLFHERDAERLARLQRTGLGLVLDGLRARKR